MFTILRIYLTNSLFFPVRNVRLRTDAHNLWQGMKGTFVSLPRFNRTTKKLYVALGTFVRDEILSYPRQSEYRAYLLSPVR